MQNVTSFLFTKIKVNTKLFLKLEFINKRFMTVFRHTIDFNKQLILKQKYNEKIIINDGCHHDSNDGKCSG